MTVSDLGLDGPRILADAIAGKFPDSQGRFGPFGGRYVPETLIPALERLERGVREHLHSEGVRRFNRSRDGIGDVVKLKIEPDLRAGS